MAVFKCSLFSIAKEKHFHPFPLLTDEVPAEKKKNQNTTNKQKDKKEKEKPLPVDKV